MRQSPFVQRDYAGAIFDYCSLQHQLLQHCAVELRRAHLGTNRLYNRLSAGARSVTYIMLVRNAAALLRIHLLVPWKHFLHSDSGHYQSDGRVRALL